MKRIYFFIAFIFIYSFSYSDQDVDDPFKGLANNNLNLNLYDFIETIEMIEVNVDLIDSLTRSHSKRIDSLNLRKVEYEINEDTIRIKEIEDEKQKVTVKYYKSVIGLSINKYIYSREYISHIKWSLKHREKIYKWQHLSSIIIFTISMIICIVGIALSWMQFKQNLKRNIDDPTNEFEMNYGGLKIKSSVIGLIILAITLGYFLLYMKYIFPIV